VVAGVVVSGGSRRKEDVFKCACACVYVCATATETNMMRDSGMCGVAFVVAWCACVEASSIWHKTPGDAKG
jgi:hypothetical protein